MGRLLQLLVLGGNLSVTKMQLSVFLFYIGLTTAAIVKREAEAEASPEADAEADPGYVRHGGYASTAPVCTLTPVKECVPRKVENPRKVCQTVVDIHEDTVVTQTCEEVVRTVCTQTSEKASHHSHVVDKSTRLVEAGVPEKKCVDVPVSTPKKVARTVCDTVVDVTTIEDCHETVTKTCQQSHTKTSSHSAVVGHETKVVATAVPVATAAVHPGAAYHG